VIAPTSDRVRGLAPAFTAIRARAGLVAVLFGLAVIGWWSTAERMSGMDDGPWTALGTLGWFLGVWVVMMAAMMFPSLAPTVALYSRMTRDRMAPLLFSAGYLVAWGAAGVAAFAVARAGGGILGDALAWDRAGVGLPARRFSPRPSMSSRRSRTSVSGSAAAPSGSCSAPGAAAGPARCGWVSGTAAGASAAAGR